MDQRLEGIRALAHRVVDAAVEVHGALTPEQRQEIAERAGKHRGR